MQEPHSFLIVALRRIGDVLPNNTAHSGVRQRYPDAISLFWYLGYRRAILEETPDISRVIGRKKVNGRKSKLSGEHSASSVDHISTQTGDHPPCYPAGRRACGVIPADGPGLVAQIGSDTASRGMG